MKNRAARLYSALLGLVVLASIWLVITAHPWPTAPKAERALKDPRLVRLERREHRLKAEALAVEKTLKRRWAVYEQRLKARRSEIADAERRHAEELEAARRAAAERASVLAAAARAMARPVSEAAPSTGPAPSTTATQPVPPAPKVRVVVLPPEVQVVTLPPITVSKSS